MKSLTLSDFTTNKYPTKNEMKEVFRAMNNSVIEFRKTFVKTTLFKCNIQYCKENTKIFTQYVTEKVYNDLKKKNFPMQLICKVDFLVSPCEIEKTEYQSANVHNFKKTIHYGFNFGIHSDKRI